MPYRTAAKAKEVAALSTVYRHAKNSPALSLTDYYFPQCSQSNAHPRRHLSQLLGAGCAVKKKRFKHRCCLPSAISNSNRTIGLSLIDKPLIQAKCLTHNFRSCTCPYLLLQLIQAI